MQYIEVNGLVRSYLLFAPESDQAKQPMPLVIALHGAGGSAKLNEELTHLSRLVETRKFILVHPNGTGPHKTWNAGNCCGHAFHRDIDDVAFIRELIDSLKTKYAIDPDRIFITGTSNGAKMAYRLACRLPGIAAIGSVAGSMDEADCEPQSPVPVIAIHGTADDFVPFKGGIPRRKELPPRVDNSVEASIDFWVRHNQCTQHSRHLQKKGIIRDGYTSCNRKADVVLYSIVGGMHVWPDPNHMGIDAPSRKISASETIIDFFLSHPRQP